MTKVVTRRDALTLVGAAAVAAALPVPVQQVLANVPAARGGVFVVGTEGERDWQIFRASDAHEAILDAVEEWSGFRDCEEGGGPKVECDCDFCYKFSQFDSQRVKEWDDRDLDKITEADWVRVGMCAPCSRCGWDEAYPSDLVVIEEKVVCWDCLTEQENEAFDRTRC